MKRIYCLSCLLFSFAGAFAQIHEPTYVDIGASRNTGSALTGLNIGKTSVTNFQIAYDTYSGSHGILFNAYKSGSSQDGNFEAIGRVRYANNEGDWNGGAAAIVFLGNGGTMDFLISPKSTGQDSSIIWGTPKLRIKRNGNVGINTTDPTEMLTVNGNVKAKKITVTENIGADYVFDSAYNLKKLSMVDAYIKEHHHLPDIPSAKQMQQEGMNLGKAYTSLLRKTEELTLYLIEQDQALEGQQKMIKALNQQLGEMEQEIKELKKK